jgi:hypothetical protein
MRKTEHSLLVELGNRKICPHCGRRIPFEAGLGTGRKFQGVFCSLDCYANYSVLEMTDRLKLLDQHVGRSKPNSSDPPS